MDAEFAYLFRHALLRSAAYELQLPGARAELHHLALEIIQELWGSAGKTLLEPLSPELSQHARLALEHPGLSNEQSDGLTQARLRYLRMGAAYCLRQHRQAEAAELYEQLAEEEPTVAGRATALHRSAAVLRNLGRLQNAEAQARLAVQATQRDDNQAQRVECTMLLASILLHGGRADEAQSLVDEIARDLETLEHHAARAEIFRMRAALHQRTGRMDEALAAHQLAIAELRETTETNRLLFSLLDLGAVCVMLRRKDVADAVTDEAVRIGRELDDDWHQGAALLHRAYFLRIEGQFNQAEPLYLESAERLKRCGNLYDLGWVWCEYGGLLHQSGRLTEAAGKYQLAVDSFSEIQAVDGWATATNNLALCLVELGRYDDARPLFDATVAFGEKQGVAWRLAEYLANRAILESDTGELEKAIRTTTRALELARGGNNPTFEPINEANLGRLFWFTGRLAEAEANLSSAIAACVKLELPYFEGAYRAEHGHFLLCAGRDGAEAELESAAAILERIGARREWAARVAPAQARVEFMSGDFAAAQETVRRADKILTNAGINEQAFSRRALAEAHECLKAARQGQPLHRGFRPDSFDPRLRAALDAG